MYPTGKRQYLNANDTWVDVAFSRADMPLVPVWENPAMEQADFFLWAFGVIMLVLVGIYAGYLVVNPSDKSIEL
ncbi:MAG: hypothetical protein Q9228_004198 [Teloschistes exilis]